MMLRLETHVIVFQPRVPASYHTTFWKKKKKKKQCHPSPSIIYSRLRCDPSWKKI